MYRMASLWLETALLPGGWAREVRITASGGHIQSVTSGTPAQPADECHAIGVPGLPNVHSHAFQRGLAGLTERRGPTDDSFWTWRELMYQFLDRMGPEELEAVSALCFAEMLEAGFTHVGEFHYVHRDCDGALYADPAELASRVAAAAAASGIGLTLLPVFYAHSGFGGAAPAPRQRRFITDTDTFARLLESCRRLVRPLAGAGVGVAPHSLRAVTPAELAAVVGLAAGGVIHIHVAEQIREVEDCVAWSGARPIEWLLGAQAVDERWCLVHATHATDAELAGIGTRGAVVGLCPMTESSLGDGIFPAVHFFAARGRIGIGTDSNILLDAAGELRTLEYSQRLARRARNVLAGRAAASTGRSLYDAALAGGWQALGGPARPGGASGAAVAPRAAALVGLAPGMPLDLVTLAAGHPALIERQADEILDSWIFSAGREVIDCVWRAGVKLVSGGRHHGRAALLARYAKALRQLRA
jgi:formimidoylglutamate deiminase